MFLTHRILSVHWLNTTMGVFMGWRVGLLCKLSNDGEPLRMEGIGRNVSFYWSSIMETISMTPRTEQEYTIKEQGHMETMLSNRPDYARDAASFFSGPSKVQHLCFSAEHGATSCSKLPAHLHTMLPCSLLLACNTASTFDYQHDWISGFAAAAKSPPKTLPIFFISFVFGVFGTTVMMLYMFRGMQCSLRRLATKCLEDATLWAEHLNVDDRVLVSSWKETLSSSRI